MTNQQIARWLEETGFPIQQININRWNIGMSHISADYDVTITDSGSWFSYAADLAADVTGDNQIEFYRRLLQLNSRLNGTHIAIEDDRITLIRDEYTEDISKHGMYRSLSLFHETHEQIFNRIVELSEELDVFFLPPK